MNRTSQLTKRVLALACALIVTATVSIGLAQGQKELVMIIPTEPGSLDAHQLFTNDDWNIAYHIYDPLLHRNSEGVFGPGLVIGMVAVDEESKVWQLELRKDVQFHNGEPWNAEVLVYNFDRVLEDPDATVRQYMAGIDSFQVVDDYTVKLMLNTPMSVVQESLYMLGMVPMEHIEAFSQRPIGTGPYEFVELQRGDYLRLKANQNYWGGVPEFENVRIRFVSDPFARVAALVSGEADVVKGLSVYDVEAVAESGSAKIVSRDGPRLWHIKVDTYRDTKSPGIKGVDANPFTDRRVREAISLAINHDELVEFGLQGYAQPANQMSAPFILGHNPELPPLGYDPERALALLQEAGYGDGFTVRFDLETGWGIVGELIGSYLGAVGIDVELNVIPSSVYKTLSTQYDTSMILGSWGATMVNTAFEGNIHSVEAEGGLGRANFGRYSNTVLDELIIDARSTFDSDAQLAKYQELQALAMADTAVIPLFFQGILVGAASGLHVQPWYNEHVMLAEVISE